MRDAVDRREFLSKTMGGAAAAALAGSWLSASGHGVVQAAPSASETPVHRPEYRGPNVIIVRFGGGVRRLETINPDHTYCPFVRHELVKQGTLYTDMQIAQLEGIETSHGQGTLYLLTGKYDRFNDVDDKFLGARFEAQVPTIFEYLRKTYDIPAHQTLIVNGEDRTDEEFYTFSNHHLFGVNYRSHVLSLYRFKTYLLRRQIARGQFKDKKLEEMQRQLARLEALDYRQTERDGQGGPIEAFWESWRQHYGETGLVNPRGDRLLTELSIRALTQIQPRLMMVNYQDPDYVHWGNMSHYTRGISVIDEGVKQLIAATQAHEAYRDNTVFVIVPDCGRDSNRFMSVPCQHHFNSKSSHEVWALLLGPGIAKGEVVDKTVQQVSVAATVGQLMGFETKFTEGPVLAEALA